jgi:hypothetical protein
MKFALATGEVKHMLAVSLEQMIGLETVAVTCGKGFTVME